VDYMPDFRISLWQILGAPVGPPPKNQQITISSGTELFSPSADLEVVAALRRRLTSRKSVSR
jgi:hypothetical protein